MLSPKTHHIKVTIRIVNMMMMTTMTTTLVVMMMMMMVVMMMMLAEMMTIQPSPSIGIVAGGMAIHQSSSSLCSNHPLTWVHWAWVGIGQWTHSVRIVTTSPQPHHRWWSEGKHTLFMPILIYFMPISQPRQIYWTIVHCTSLYFVVLH